MAYDWITVKVFGTYVNIDGSAAVGSVLFKPNFITNTMNDLILLPNAISAQLDANGYFEAQLAVTNDPESQVEDWAWLVTERIREGRDPFYIQIDYQAEEVNMATVVPVVEPVVLESIRGPQGPEGPEGPQGPQGPAGQDGNAQIPEVLDGGNF